MGNELKNYKKLLLISYSFFSLLDFLWHPIKNIFYHTGYEMGDITTVLIFITLSIVYLGIWYITIEDGNANKTTYQFIFMFFIMLFVAYVISKIF